METERAWRYQVNAHCSALTGRPAAAVTAAEVEDVLDRHASGTIACKNRGRLRAVFSEAVKRGLRSDNPVLSTDPVARPAITHRESIPHGKMADVLAVIRGCGEFLGARLCLEWVVLTACRSGEATGATWAEVDLAERVWTIPTERAKTGKAHRVALSDQAMALLDRLGEFPAGNLLFPSASDGMLTAKSLRRVPAEPGQDNSRGSGVGGTVHGFRSSFRTWAQETGIDHRTAEPCLAHVNRDQVEAAHLRSDLLDQRRQVMQDWADYTS